MYKRIVPVLASVLILLGCKGLGAQITAEEVCKKLTDLKAYSCDVDLKVTNNKSTMEYKMKHYYKQPDKYKVVVLEPAELSGQTTIYNGKRAYTYHPKIGQVLVTENFQASVEHNSFVGSFINYLGSMEKIKARKETLEGSDYYLLEFDIPGGSNYMCVQKIWVDTGKMVPYKSEIFDKDGNPTAVILYDHFILNPELEDKVFEIAH